MAGADRRSLIRSLLVGLLGGLFLINIALAEPGCGPRRVLLTFDDAPTADSAVMTGEERTRRLIDALRQAAVPEAIFFLVSSRIDAQTMPRVEAYAKAGHVIANHTHSHPNLHVVGAEYFLDDVLQAHQILSGLDGFQPYFRFPYINQGISPGERDIVRAGLKAMGYRAGYITIDNFDFYIDRLLNEAVEAGETVDMAAVGALYTDMILGAARHYDAIACQWLGRSPAHVLLLHENDMAALFLGDLAAALRAEGWDFIGADEAYSDPIAEIEPDTLVLGQGRVAALAAMRGANPADLRHEGENTELLEAAFETTLSD